MHNRFIILFLFLSNLMMAVLIPQPVVNGYQRLTKDLSDSQLGKTLFGYLKGEISFKYSSSNEWVTICADRAWSRLIYIHSYLQNGERVLFQRPLDKLSENECIVGG